MEFGVLGPLVVRNGGEAIRLTSTKQQILLAVLLCHANIPVSRERLLEALWQEPPASAAENLRLYVHRLRRVLRAPQRITSYASGYLLAVHPGEADADRFGELAAEAGQARETGDLKRAGELLTGALALWRGKAYDGIAQIPLIRETAARLEEERVRAVEERVGIDLTFGRHADVVPELTMLVDEHPYREVLRRHLMLALYRSGRQSEALEVFRRTRSLLIEELGVEPGPELRLLHEAMLRGEEDLWSPPHPSPPPVPRELPTGVYGFTGRADALKVLDETLSGDHAGAAAPVALAVIAGPAGVGKTALGLRWAQRITHRFPDGQLYLNLRGYSAEPPLRPMEALTAFLRALGTPPQRMPSDQAQAAAQYRSLLADRRMLVLLDNAASAEQVRPLLPGALGCLVVVTSRDRLSGLIAREGARRITLDVLTPAEARELLASFLGERRIALEPEAVAEIAELCGRLPLALRIAAAHLADRPLRRIADYAAELAEGNPLATLEIAGDSGTAVRAALDGSYETLSSEERRMFRLLGIAPGMDFTVEAAAAASDRSPEQTARLLDQLAAAHLLEERVAGRFAFHDLVRLYAQAQAHAEDSVEERVVAVGRVYRWYLSAADSAAGLLYSHLLRMPPLPVPAVRFEEAGDARRWLDAESVNLVVATVEAAEGGAPREAWHLAMALRGYYWLSGDADAAMTTAEAGLAAARASRDLRGEAGARLTLGQTLSRLGRTEEAFSHLDRVIDLTERLDWPECRASALTVLGNLHLDRGRLERSADSYRQALRLDLERGNMARQAVNLANLAFVALHAGNLKQAVADCEDVLRRYRVAGSGDGHPAVLDTLGHACHLLGRFEESLGHFEHALKIYRKIGNTVEEPLVLAACAAVHLDAGRREQALRQAEAAVRAASGAGERTQAGVLVALGSVHRYLGRLPSALRHLQRAQAAADVIADRLLDTRIRIELAATRLATADVAVATADAEHALALAKDAGYRVWEGRALLALAEADLTLGRVERGAERAARALALHRETGHSLGQGQALLLLADAAPGAGPIRA
ncbi:tetratricopeptide repeat protein [Microtetraspora sp. AC03309]|uniref:AfsR/SARP family transcriptional regulator n=1 Tax=Microtetraspora sp. AC03309 TaxID=2779376 RepID=UPI001E3E2532|nr:BTAD domain-containing putative transcriptional regulator [Microtetraspora sp. AC03309]MCC5580959.1 tetratricopeptide repeat protein [Microtetraspora sp. AC03309]